MISPHKAPAIERAEALLERLPAQMEAAKTISDLLRLIGDQADGIDAILRRDAYVARNLPYMTKEQIGYWLGTDINNADAPDFPQRLDIALQLLYVIAGWKAQPTPALSGEDCRVMAQNALREMGIFLTA